MGTKTIRDLRFGGPDRIPGKLRDLLADRIAAVPAGGSIEWVTYYFRDRRLAYDLIDAHKRGVEVRVTLDGYPRTSRACTSSKLFGLEMAFAKRRFLVST